MLEEKVDAFLNQDTIELFEFIDQAMSDSNPNFHDKFIITTIKDSHFDYLDVLQQFVRNNYTALRNLVTVIYTYPV
jgi:hypothetical protein